MLILLGIMFIGANLLAQVTMRVVDQHVLSARKTFYTYTGVAADTVGTDKDSLYFEIQVNKNTPISFAARIEVTQTGATDNYGMDLEGKVFENDYWTKILELASQNVDTSLYEPSASLVDSINQATINSANSDNYFRYFRVLIHSDGDVLPGDKLTIDYIIWKFWER